MLAAGNGAGGVDLSMETIVVIFQFYLTLLKAEHTVKFNFGKAQISHPNQQLHTLEDFKARLRIIRVLVGLSLVKAVQ